MQWLHYGTIVYATEALNVLQHSSAPSNDATASREWIAESFHGHMTTFIWSTSSPDLNLLDNCEGKIVEKHVDDHLHNTKETLKASTVRVMSNMNTDYLIRA